MSQPPLHQRPLTRSWCKCSGKVIIPNFVPETEAGLAEGDKNGKTVAHWIRRHIVSFAIEQNLGSPSAINLLSRGLPSSASHGQVPVTRRTKSESFMFLF
jgi:hypothetical protein